MLSRLSSSLLCGCVGIGGGWRCLGGLAWFPGPERTQVYMGKGGISGALPVLPGTNWSLASRSQYSFLFLCLSLDMTSHLLKAVLFLEAQLLYSVTRRQARHLTLFVETGGRGTWKCHLWNLSSWAGGRYSHLC